MIASIEYAKEMALHHGTPLSPHISKQYFYLRAHQGMRSESYSVETPGFRYRRDAARLHTHQDKMYLILPSS